MTCQKVLICATVLAALCLPAAGQVTTASLYGTVQDPTGAALPGAEVTLVNTETGVSRSQNTSATGEFAFQFVPVGTYSLQIGATGFKTFQSRGLELGAAQQARRVYVLELGSISERVEVVGQAPLGTRSPPNSAKAFHRPSCESCPWRAERCPTSSPSAPVWRPPARANSC
jgi:hypothetical protein